MTFMTNVGYQCFCPQWPRRPLSLRWRSSPAPCVCPFVCRVQTTGFFASLYQSGPEPDMDSGVLALSSDGDGMTTVDSQAVLAASGSGQSTRSITTQGSIAYDRASSGEEEDESDEAILQCLGSIDALDHLGDRHQPATLSPTVSQEIMTMRRQGSGESKRPGSLKRRESNKSVLRMVGDQKRLESFLSNPTP
jgi:hypothetical protein